MPNLSAKQLSELSVLIRRDLQASYDFFAKNNWASEFALIMTVNKQTVTFPWVNDRGILVERKIGEAPNYGSLTGQSAVITLKSWEDAVRVSAYNLSDDDTGQLLSQAQQIGRNAAYLVKDGVIDILINGNTSAYVMYDGQNYFADAHVKKPGITYDNLLSGALSLATYQAARVAMWRFPSDFGASRPLGINPTHLIVPPELEVTAKEIVNNSLLPSSGFNTQNQLMGTSIVIVEPRLTDTNDWYLISNDGPVKPFFHLKHQDFSPFQIHAEISDDSPAYRDHDERRWWGRTMEVIWPTHPYMAIKVVN